VWNTRDVLSSRCWNDLIAVSKTVRDVERAFMSMSVSELVLWKRARLLQVTGVFVV
jgi:hypothetical protein